MNFDAIIASAITMIALKHDNFREIRANITWYREKLVVKFDQLQLQRFNNFPTRFDELPLEQVTCSDECMDEETFGSHDRSADLKIRKFSERNKAKSTFIMLTWKLLTYIRFGIVRSRVLKNTIQVNKISMHIFQMLFYKFHGKVHTFYNISYSLIF